MKWYLLSAKKEKFSCAGHQPSRLCFRFTGKMHLAWTGMTEKYFAATRIHAEYKMPYNYSIRDRYIAASVKSC
jgi:hypothetical protein